MKSLKVRTAATALAAMLAVGTIVGAVALQRADPDAAVSAGSSTVTTDNAPIVYSGGYGLFPAAH